MPLSSASRSFLMPSDSSTDLVHRKDRTVFSRLYSCFVQGITIGSAAEKLKLSELEVTVMYMRFSLGAVSAELRRYEHL